MSRDFIHLPAIHKNLYIGNIHAAKNYRWDAIICTAGCERGRSVAKELLQNCEFLDTANTNYQPKAEAEFFIRTGALLLDNALREVQAQSSERQPMVLVHCRAGMNRSASVIVAYAVGRNKQSAKEVIDYIRAQNSKRLRVDPAQAALTNPLFEKIVLNMHWSRDMFV